MPTQHLKNALASQDWYYSIELEPGIVTPGTSGHPTVLTRRLLSHCAVDGASCLDIGPMEAMIPAVLARRGARAITATDVLNIREPQIALVKKHLGFDLEFIAPLMLTDTPARFQAENRPAFDIVVYSGVLYHVLDFTASLGAVRALVRPGGLVVIEGWIRRGREAALYFNERGVFTDECNTFWFATIGALDYLLRFFQLEPLDCAYFANPADTSQTLRFATVCRATDQPAGTDNWMRRARHGVDAGSWRGLLLRADDTRPLSYDNTQSGLNLSDFVEHQPPAIATNRDATLWLDDRI